MDITQLLSWLTGGPNFTPFLGVEAPFRIIFGLILAIVALWGLWLLVKGFFIYGIAGRNTPKRHTGIEDMKQGGIQILVVFAIGLVLAIAGGVLSAVFGSVPG